MPNLLYTNSHTYMYTDRFQSMNKSPAHYSAYSNT